MERHNCDYLILDHGLPGMTGLEPQNQLAASDRRPPIFLFRAETMPRCEPRLCGEARSLSSKASSPSTKAVPKPGECVTSGCGVSGLLIHG